MTTYKESGVDIDLANKSIDSIKNKVLILHDNTKIFPGHGPSTKIGIEKNQNPFLQ